MAVLILSPNGKFISKPTLADAATSPDAAGKRILVTSPITIDSITIPAGVTLQLEAAAIITINNGRTLTINGPLIHGLTQCFAGAGAVVIAGEAPAFTLPVVASLRAYSALGFFPGVVQVKGRATVGDGLSGAGYMWKYGAAAGTYTDNGTTVIVPTGGDGSEAWVAVYPVAESAATATNATNATTQIASDNSTKIATTAFVKEVLKILHPVGSIYTNATDSTNPATLLGFGTWAAFGGGRVPIGFTAGDTLFDSGGKTGGSRNAIVVSHTHTGSTGIESAGHSHATGDGGSHKHDLLYGYPGADTWGRVSIENNSENTGWMDGVSTAPNHNHGQTGGASASHDHSFTTAASGSSGTNANLPPYITVYMWKRTA